MVNLTILLLRIYHVCDTYDFRNPIPSCKRQQISLTSNTSLNKEASSRQAGLSWVRAGITYELA